MERGKSNLGCRMLFVLLATFFMIACLVTSNSKIKIQSSDSKNIKEITKVDLDEILASHSTEWVYIGRPSCPDCAIFCSKLIKWLDKNEKNIFYFDTSCKASQKEEMRVYIKSFGIEEIPSILRIDNGNIEVFDMLDNGDVKKFYNIFFKEN